MAFVVRRRDRRFEIRESEATARGPRARTLATFHELSDEVMDAAAERATGVLDRARLRARAIALGAHVPPPAAVRAAHELLRSIGPSDPLPADLRAVVHHALAASEQRDARELDHLLAMVPWLSASEQRRGDSLVDLLHAVASLPTRSRGALRYPKLEPR